MTSSGDVEAPHIAALRRSVSAGFQYLHLPERDNRTIMAIHAERHRGDVVDTYLIQAMTEAVAVRFRAEDYPRGDPLWQMFGTVEEVIDALLALPPHGAPGAPTLVRPASSSLDDFLLR